MATAGPNFPTNSTGNTNTVGGGTRVWSNPNNINAADSVFATCTFAAANAISDDLNGQGFGFAIPAGATINGIKLEVNYADGVATATETHVRLLKAGVAAGLDKSTGATLPISPATVSYGGVADLWGTTWTPADINATNFGAVTTYTNNTSILTVSVDFFRITVTYTPSATASSQMFQMF